MHCLDADCKRVVLEGRVTKNKKREHLPLIDHKKEGIFCFSHKHMKTHKKQEITLTEF